MVGGSACTVDMYDPKHHTQRARGEGASRASVTPTRAVIRKTTETGIIHNYVV